MPVVSAIDGYGQEVKERLHDAGFMADIDMDPGRTLNKKIRNGQLQQYNFILGRSSLLALLTIAIHIATFSRLCRILTIACGKLPILRLF